MTLITQPLRDEHRGLLPHVEHVRQLGDMAGRDADADVRTRLRAVVGFLGNRLLPHAEAEDAVLYPAVDRLIGAGATATMSRDHVEVRRMTDELAALLEAAGERPFTAGELTDIRRLAYGLAALIALHFAKEEEIYLPLLDRALSPDEGRSLFAELERAAGDRPHRGS